MEHGSLNLTSNQDRKIFISLIIAILLHLFFIFFLAPHIKLERNLNLKPTEVVQISPQELKNLKEKILNKKTLTPVLEQELDERYKTKTPDKNAKFIGKFNQTFQEEQVIGATHDAPKGQNFKSEKNLSQKEEQKNKPKIESLKDLGFKDKVLISRNFENSNANERNSLDSSTPVGRDLPNLKKGNQNLLNTVENEYYSFFVRFEDPIIRNWFFLVRQYEAQIRSEMQARHFEIGQEANLILEFSIDREGNFISIDIISTSGLPTLDRVTKLAVQKLGSLPNPPAGLFEDKANCALSYNKSACFTHRLSFGVILTNAPMWSTNPNMNWY
jgi:hypothetical protein